MSLGTRTIIATALVVAIALFAVARLELTYQLTAFLPPPATNAQSVLSETLASGAGSQLIFVALPDTDSAAVTDIAIQLRESGLFKRVWPDQTRPSLENLPAPLWKHRLLLDELPDDVTGWQEILRQRSDDLMFGADETLLSLIAADPALNSVNALEQFATASAQTDINVDGKSILILESRASAYDAQAQTATIEGLREMLSPVEGAELYGAPVYATDLQSSVRNEATLFSLLASCALLVFVIFRFRRWQYVLGIAVPLAAGGAMGLLALTLLFPSVHGITLAFGFTLLGVAIDYPLHIFSHPPEQHSTTVWPTLRLGILSTLIAYAAFIASGTVGLQQLGIFATVGILCAAVTSAMLTYQQSTPLPDSDSPDTSPSTTQFRFIPCLALCVAGTLGLLNEQLFSDDLSALTPVDAEILARDNHIRTQLGTTDSRYLIAVSSAQLEDNLLANERILSRLQPLMADNALQGARSISQILPSESVQNSRLDTLTQADALADFATAAETVGFTAEAFAPFLANWRRLQQNPATLTLDELVEDPQLGSAVASMLYPASQGWRSLIFLQGLQSKEALQDILAAEPEAELVDLKASANEMVADYRTRLVSLLAGALLIIAVIIGTRLRWRRALWSFATVSAAVLCAAALSAWLQQGLSLFDLMALALVGGLGLDYALFYGRDGNHTEVANTAAAVQVCAISSFMVFAVLALSSIPVLHGLGLTVSLGVVFAYGLARWGRYEKAAI